jgi:uncharacterized membrane protein
MEKIDARELSLVLELLVSAAMRHNMPRAAVSVLDSWVATGVHVTVGAFQALLHALTTLGESTLADQVCNMARAAYTNMHACYFNIN